MGAVKTNRKMIALSWSDGWNNSFVEFQKANKGYVDFIRDVEPNNRRKMAGLPMIRRAKS